MKTGSPRRGDGRGAYTRSPPPVVGKLRVTGYTPHRDRARSGNIRRPSQRQSRQSSAPTVPICAATGGGIGRLAGPRARIRASAVATAAPASAPPALAGHPQIHGAAHVHQRRRNAQRNNNSFHRTSPCRVLRKCIARRHRPCHMCRVLHEKRRPLPDNTGSHLLRSKDSPASGQRQITLLRRCRDDREPCLRIPVPPQ